MFASVVTQVDDLGDRMLAERAKELAATIRQAEAELAAIISTVERSDAFRADGHGSIGSWVKATLGCTRSEANQRVRLGRLVHRHPVVGAALWDGHLEVAGADAMATANAHPRVGHEFAQSVVSRLLEVAPALGVDGMRTRCATWIRLMDADGARRDESANEHRNLTVLNFAGRFSLVAQGDGVSGEELESILDRFVDTEFRADWDAAFAVHGERTSKVLLTRTDSQRRFDALVTIFRTAAAAATPGRGPVPVVNYVIDQATYDAHLAALALGAPVRRDPLQVVASGRSETLGGLAVDPGQIVAASMVGYVRRVVVDSAGTVIDQGRRRRLFTGSARHAVLVQHQRCVWPGCDQPARRCQADHTVPWSHGGSTSPGNGDLCCARHNRWKNHGYVTHRDSGGVWHTLRPDGTEI